jgi:hypothetical protein
VVLIFALYNSFTIPYELSFDVKINDSQMYVYFDNFIDFLFAIDLLLSFNTSYMDNKGDEVKCRKLIMKRYLFSMAFLLDTGALFGSDFVGKLVPQFILFGFLKITRIFRMGTLIKKSNNDKNTKALLNFMKITFYLVIFLHCVACTWYIAVK